MRALQPGLVTFSSNNTYYSWVLLHIISSCYNARILITGQYLGLIPRLRVGKAVQQNNKSVTNTIES